MLFNENKKNNKNLIIINLENVTNFSWKIKTTTINLNLI